MKKLDLKKTLKHLYVPSAKQIQVVNVPRMRFAMINGMLKKGETPETSGDFQDDMKVLYGVSYTLKFMSKMRKKNPIDYTVMALEGLWWIDTGEFDFNVKTNWYYTVMILQPDHITDEMYEEAFDKLSKKKDSPALDKVRFEYFDEGMCIQVMHIGPYSAEPQTVKLMNDFAQENNFFYTGKHHEIYLGDPRKSQPESLKTVLRHPVKKAK